MQCTLIVLFAGSLENLLHKSINSLARWRVGSRDTGLRSFSFSPPCVTVIKCKTSSGDTGMYSAGPLWRRAGLPLVWQMFLFLSSSRWPQSGAPALPAVSLRGVDSSLLCFSWSPRASGWNGCSVPGLAGTDVCRGLC